MWPEEKKLARLRTRPARGHRDVAAFFDAGARTYAEQHGDADGLLRYRVGLLREGARLRPDDTVLEIGCGTGIHLLALAGSPGSDGSFGRGLGTDLSPGMVAVARERLAAGGSGDRIRFAVADAERLDPVADAAVDVVVCVGALEHMLDQAAVLESVFRVLKPGGRFVCLTVNGGSLWYRLAPALGIDSRQLATDHYLTRGELESLAAVAGFAERAIDFWTFVQRGDMPGLAAAIFTFLDRVGAVLRLGALRGGLRLIAVKPPAS